MAGCWKFRVFGKPPCRTCSRSYCIHGFAFIRSQRFFPPAWSFGIMLFCLLLSQYHLSPGTITSQVQHEPSKQYFSAQCTCKYVVLLVISPFMSGIGEEKRLGNSNHSIFYRDGFTLHLLGSLFAHDVNLCQPFPSERCSAILS